MALDRTFIESAAEVVPNLKNGLRYATVIGGYSIADKKVIEQFLEEHSEQLLDQTGVCFDFITFNDLIKNKAAALGKQQNYFYRQVRALYNETKEHNHSMPFFI